MPETLDLEPVADAPALDLEPVATLDLEPIATPSLQTTIPEPGVAQPTLRAPQTIQSPVQAFPATESRIEALRSAQTPELSVAEAEQILTTPNVTIPRFGEPGTVTRGLSELGAGLVEQAALTPAAPLINLATIVPGVRVAAGTLLAAAGTKAAAQKLGEASVTGNPQTITEGVGLGALSALGAVGVAADSIAAKGAPASAEALKATTDLVKPETPLTEGVANASKVEEATAVHGNVLSEAPKGQSTETVPVSESQPGVRTQGEVATKSPEADAAIAEPSIGPGAASPSDFPKETQIKQLTEAIKPTEPVVAPLGTRIANEAAIIRSQLATKAENALNTLKATGRAVYDSLKGETPWTDFKDTLGKYSGAINRNSFELQGFTKEIRRTMPDRVRREAVVNWLQADGDPAVLAARAAASKKASLRRGYETAQSLTPDEMTLADNVRSYLDSKLAEGIDAGLLKSGIENYVSQVWDRPNPIANKLIGEAASGKLSPNFKFARKRIFDSYFEGEQAGFTPKIKDIGALVAVYDQSFSRAIAARKLIKSLHEGKASDGRPLVEVSGVSNLLAENGSPEALLIKPKAKPEELGGYLPIDHPALRDWKWAGTDPETGASILYQGDLLVHPEAHTHLKNVLSTSALRQNAFFRGLLEFQGILKQSKLALSGFHFTQEGTHAASHRVNPLAPGKIDFTIKDQSALVDHGLQIADYRAYQAFAEGVSGAGSIYERIPVAGKWLTRYNEYLFQEYIPRLKMTMAMDALERNRARYGKKLSDDQILELTANQSNAAFGELNYAMLGRNPTFQDFIRLAILAPDFLEARARFAAQALTKTGTEQRVALALQAATLYVGARIINQALDGDPHWEPKYAFSIIANKRQYGVRSVVEDTMHFLNDRGKFIGNRLSPFARAASEFTSGRDWRGVKRSSIEQLQDLADWLLPITADRQPMHTRTDTALGAAGVTVRSATASKRLYEQLKEFKADKNLLSADEKAEQSALSEYAPLRSAILSGDEKAMRKEYEALLQPSDGVKAKTPRQVREHFTSLARMPFSGSRRVEQQFIRSLDKKGMDLYLEARKERREIAVTFLEAQKRWMKEGKK